MRKGKIGFHPKLLAKLPASCEPLAPVGGDGKTRLVLQCLKNLFVYLFFCFLPCLPADGEPRFPVCQCCEANPAFPAENGIGSPAADSLPRFCSNRSSLHAVVYLERASFIIVLALSTPLQIARQLNFPSPVSALTLPETSSGGYWRFRNLSATKSRSVLSESFLPVLQFLRLGLHLLPAIIGEQLSSWEFPFSSLEIVDLLLDRLSAIFATDDPCKVPNNMLSLSKMAI